MYHFLMQQSFGPMPTTVQGEDLGMRCVIIINKYST